MVLVRVRLEKEDGSVHYFKSFITLPADVLLSKLCSDTIGPKIGLVDFTNYTISDVGSNQDGTPILLLNYGDILAGKVKNGEYLLVKYAPKLNEVNNTPTNELTAQPQVEDSKPTQSPPIQTIEPTKQPIMEITQPTVQISPTQPSQQEQPKQSTQTPQGEQPEKPTQPIIQPIQPIIQPTQPLLSTQTSQPIYQTPEITTQPSTIQSNDSSQPQETIPIINVPHTSIESSPMSTSRPLSPVPDTTPTSIASPSLMRARMQRRNSIDSSTLFRFKNATQSPLISTSSTATVENIPSFNVQAKVNSSSITQPVIPNNTLPPSIVTSGVIDSTELPLAPVSEVKLETAAPPPTEIFNPPPVGDIPQPLQSHPIVPVVNVAAFSGSTPSPRTPKSPVPRLSLEALSSNIQLPSPTATLPPPIAIPTSPTTIPAPIISLISPNTTSTPIPLNVASILPVFPEHVPPPLVIPSTTNISPTTLSTTNIQSIPTSITTLPENISTQSNNAIPNVLSATTNTSPTKIDSSHTEAISQSTTNPPSPSTLPQSTTNTSSPPPLPQSTTNISLSSPLSQAPVSQPLPTPTPTVTTSESSTTSTPNHSILSAIITTPTLPSISVSAPNTKSITTSSSIPPKVQQKRTSESKANGKKTRTESNKGREKGNSEAARWICETLVREVVEESLVECVDVRNYLKRPPHIPPSRAYEVASKKRDESGSGVASASITAQLNQMTEEFGRVVGALEHLQGFVTSLQAKAVMKPEPSFIPYQVEEEERPRGMQRPGYTHDSPPRRQATSTYSSTSRQVPQPRPPSPTRTSHQRASPPSHQSHPPPSHRNTHSFGLSRASTPIPNAIPLPHTPPRPLFTPTPQQQHQQQQQQRTQSRAQSPSRSHTPLYLIPSELPPTRNPSPIPVRPPSPIPSRPPSPHVPQRPLSSLQMRPPSPTRARSPSRLQPMPTNLTYNQNHTIVPVSVSKPKKIDTSKRQPSTSRSNPQKFSSSQPSQSLRTSNNPSTTRTHSRSLAATYASSTLPSPSYSSLANKASKSKSASPSTNKLSEKKYSDAQNLRNVGEVISNLQILDTKPLQTNTTNDFSKIYPEPIYHPTNANPLYPSIQHTRTFDTNGKDFDSSHPHNPIGLLRETVNGARNNTYNPPNTTFNTTFNTTIHHQATSSFNSNPYPTISNRPPSPTRGRMQDTLLVTFNTADGGEYVVPSHVARHSRIVSATLASSLTTAASHRFEFSTVTAEVMGAILKFLENPFVHFLNSRKGGLLLPSNPFQHIGAAKAILAGDAMEIPLVIVYCCSLLLAAGNNTELQKYLPATFLFTRCPIADWYALQDTIESLLPTTATHHTSPTPSVVTTTTTRPTCESGMDFLWHVRFINDFGAEDIKYRDAVGAWMRVYAESRVQSFLLAGLDHLDELELVQWKRHMAPLVLSLDLSSSGVVSDNVVSLVISLCENLQRLDLHKSKITDESLLLIAEAAREGRELVWLNLQHTNVSLEGVHSFSLCCPNTSIVI